MIETDNDKSTIKAIALISVVLRDRVAGKEQSRIGLKAERVLVLLFHGQEVLSDQGFEDTVVVDVFCRKVGEDIRQLTEKLCRLEPFVQRLPGNIRYILSAEQDLIEDTKQYGFTRTSLSPKLNTSSST